MRTDSTRSPGVLRASAVKLETLLTKEIAWIISKAVFVLLVLAPLCALALEASSGDSNWRQALLPSGRRLELLLRSVGLAATVAVAATGVGLLAALRLWRYQVGRLARLKWLVLVMAPVPPYVHALAWATALRFLSTGVTTGGPLAVQGWLLAWWVDIMAFLPIAVGLCLLGLEGVQPALIESGRVIRSDLRTLTGIVLPLAVPGILAAFVAVLLFSLMDYSVPSIFGINVYALEIFAGYSASAGPAEPILLAIPLVAIAGLAVIAALRPLRKAASASSKKALGEMAPLAFPKWFRLMERGGLIVLFLQVLAPLVVLTALMERPAAMLRTLQFAGHDIAFSLWIAAMSALLCLAPALGAGHALVGDTSSARVWWIMTLLPLAIPASLVGIGLIALWNRPGFGWLYDSAWMPVLASLARFLPWASLIMLAHLKRLDQSLIDAARVHGPSSLRSWLRVDLPMAAPGLLAAAMLVFALTLGELGATLLVVPPGRSTLTIRIYNYLHYGGSDEVATLCLVMLCAGVIAAVTVWAVLVSWSRLVARE